LIDNYYGVLGTAPVPILEQIKELPGAVGEYGRAAVARTRELLDAARELAVPVVHITGLDGMPGWGVRRQGGGRRAPSADLVAAGKGPYDIVEDLAPIEGEVVLRKSAPSAFWGTPLVGQLNFLGVDTVIACGESTSGCLRASVVDGTTNRSRMIVPERDVSTRPPGHAWPPVLVRRSTGRSTG
jgi:nicotinamidase-related amidase